MKYVSVGLRCIFFAHVMPIHDSPGAADHDITDTFLVSGENQRVEDIVTLLPG